MGGEEEKASSDGEGETIPPTEAPPAGDGESIKDPSEEKPESEAQRPRFYIFHAVCRQDEIILHFNQVSNYLFLCAIIPFQPCLYNSHFSLWESDLCTLPQLCIK